MRRATPPLVTFSAVFLSIILLRPQDATAQQILGSRGANARQPHADVRHQSNAALHATAPDDTVLTATIPPLHARLPGGVRLYEGKPADTVVPEPAGGPASENSGEKGLGNGRNGERE